MTQIIVQDSLADKVYGLLKSRILSGELQGGMTIPEEQLARQFGVSRTPIREAVRRLAEYGLVVLKPRSHAMVHRVDGKEAGDIARVRIALEQLAVDSLTPETIERNIDRLSRLAADCQYYLGIGDRAALFEKDSLFHLELVKCAGNDALYTLYERLDSRIQLLRIAQNLPEDELGRIVSQHGQMLRHLRAGDKDACRDLVLRHVTHACEPAPGEP